MLVLCATFPEKAPPMQEISKKVQKELYFSMTPRIIFS
jgi:hypothetical protein